MRRRGAVLTTRGRAFLACGVTLVLAGGLLGFADLTRVGVLLLALPLVGLALGRRPPALQVRRIVAPAPVTQGETATVALRVTNTGSHGTGLLLAQEVLAPALGDPPRFVLGALGPQDVRATTYAVSPRLRGHHELGPLALRVRDPFGLTDRHVQVGDEDELVVLPRTEALGGARPPGAGIGAEGQVPHLVSLHGEDDQSIREYRDGDDLRRIHWPATAKVGDLMVRQEDRPARRRAVVLLDSRAEAHRGEGLTSSFEWAVCAAASVVVHLASLGYAVHLVTQESLAQRRVDAVADPRAALEVLADARLGSTLGLADVAAAGQALAAGGGLLVAIVAAYDEPILRQVARTRAPGGSAVAMVVDTESFASGRGARSRTDHAADTLAGAGWATTVVDDRTSVHAAWQRVSRSARWVGSADSPAVVSGPGR